MINEEAFRAAESTYMEKIVELRLAEGGGFKVPSQQKRAMRAALEAAAPYIIQAWINDTSRLPNALPGYGPEGRIPTNPHRSQP